MAEDYQHPYELWKTDHGIDGWDARTWHVANFSSIDKAIAYLAKRGFTHKNSFGDFYWHAEEAQRHTMGAISYQIRKSNQTIPSDPD